MGDASGDRWRCNVAFYESVQITRKDGGGRCWVPGWVPVKRSLPWGALCRCMTTFREVRDGETEDDRKARVPLWSPGVPVGEHRSKGEVAAVSCLVLDIDGGVDFREVARDAFGSWPLVWHTSFRTSPSRPKGRIVVPLEVPVPVAWWPRVWWWANRRCGGAMDPATKDAGRVYYLPATDGRDGHAAEVVDDFGGLLDLRPWDALPLTPDEEEEERRKELAARMPIPRWSPATADDGTREKKYGLKVLQSTCAKVASAGKGQRNPALTRAAYLIGGYVETGAIDEGDALEALIAAGMACGLSSDEAGDVARRQLEMGKARPVRVELD